MFSSEEEQEESDDEVDEEARGHGGGSIVARGRSKGGQRTSAKADRTDPIEAQIASRP